MQNANKMQTKKLGNTQQIKYFCMLKTPCNSAALRLFHGALSGIFAMPRRCHHRLDCKQGAKRFKPLLQAQRNEE